jgi:adenylate cyclase
MQVKLTEGEQARLRYTTTTNVPAWTLWVQGLSHYRQSISKEKVGAAKTCWEKALALDPTSAALDAMLGWLHCLDARFGWWEDRATAVGKAEVHIKSALQKDPDNADAHIASAGLLSLEGRFDEAVASARRAARLAPSSADVANLVSFHLVAAGHAEEAIAHSKRAIALNPNYPPNYLGNLGLACRLAGRVEEAVAAFNAYDARIPGSGFGLTDLVILYQQNGRSEEARQTAQRLLAARPDFTIASWRKTQIARDAGRFDDEVAALRAAGLPFG